MSNVALFNNQLPDYLKEVELDDVTKALSGGGGSQVKRIALGNNKFVLKVDGTEVSKTNTDKLEVVIVNASKHISRTFSKTAIAALASKSSIWTSGCMCRFLRTTNRANACW